MHAAAVLPRHQDAAAGAFPSSAATPMPSSARGLTAAGHPSPVSMVAVVQEQWLHLCDYFQRVQCANTHDERATLVRELGSVEQALSVVLDALLTDRQSLVSRHPALHGHGSIFGGSSFRFEAVPASHSLTEQRHQHRQPPVPPARASVAEAGARGTATATRAASPPVSLTSSARVLDGLDGSGVSLPPCYRFLFTDALSVAPTPPPPPPPLPAAEKEALPSACDGATTATATADDEQPPIGNMFLLTLCQYAKQDEPPGVRAVILGFLARLLQEADLPTDRAAYPAGDSAMSLLQLNPSMLIVPLLDMVRKVSKALDPANAAAVRATSAAAATAAASPALRWVTSDPHSGTFLQDAGRTQFVIFLSTLAEKMERVPALANFFVVEEGSQERNLFVLLDALLLYLTHDCSTPEWSHRRDTCRFALSAVVSLAKCPDPWIQDLVGKEERVVSRTLGGARTTLLTLCKIPDNDDGATQLLYLRDVLRFWATLMAMAPSVAAALRLQSLIEREFVHQSLLPLLQSSDSHVYAAACVVVANVLGDLQGSAPLLTGCFAKALLSTTIRKASGRIVPGKEFYEVVVQDPVSASAAARSGGRAWTRGQQEEKAAASLHEHAMTSFFAYYILPHLSSNPCLSEEDKESCAVLGFATTRWSATKATLLLVQTLAEHVPHVFLREVFLMDVTSLADVQRKQAASPPGAVADGRKSAESWGNTGSPPLLSIHDCFLSDLHAAAAASSKIGLQPDRVGEAVLSRLLRVESNMPVAALQAQQRLMSAMAVSGTAAPAEDVRRSRTPPAAAPTSTATANFWFHAGVQLSPLVTALCGMVHHLDSTPYTVSSLVADLIVSLAVMPDMRVLYTLLDPQRGPLVTALCGLRDLLRHHLNSKVTETSPIKKGKNSSSNSGGGAGSGAAPAARPLAVSIPFLYDMLLRHWDLLVDDDDAEGGKAPATPDRVSRDAEVSAESLRGAIEANGNVLHACLYSEYLHAYLDAAIGYTALSQNLMYLKVPG